MRRRGDRQGSKQCCSSSELEPSLAARLVVRVYVGSAETGRYSGWQTISLSKNKLTYFQGKGVFSITKTQALGAYQKKLLLLSKAVKQKAFGTSHFSILHHHQRQIIV